MPILLLLPVTWTSHPLVWCSDPLGAEVGQEADRASHQPDPQVSPGGLSPVPHTHTHTPVLGPPAVGKPVLPGRLLACGRGEPKESLGMEKQTHTL